MSFSKNLTITVRNTVAQLDEPLYVYEKDRNLIMYFKIMDYKYKFDKNPTNVLASVDDIMEAYATIVDPNGYELTRQYGEVIEDEIKFIITDDLIDELDEIGTYRIQFHIRCQHSEFTIPEISFEVLERLKGFRTVTDEGEVGDEILNNSESFIDAEGKLHLVWREGDTISSVRLNQMVEVVNNAVDEEHQRQINEVNRENRANAKLEELETRFSALTTSQQQSAEVIDARDGEASLKARLDRDVKKTLEYYANVEGSYITTDSSSGYLKDVEILGNTIQNEDNLEDIRSVGNKIEGQELYEIPVESYNERYSHTITFDSSRVDFVFSEFFVGGTTIVNKSDKPIRPILGDENGSYVGDGTIDAGRTYTIPNGNKVKKFSLYAHQGWTMTNDYVLDDIMSIEGAERDELTILSPVQLEKVGDVADRIIEKDGVWGVEKNIIKITKFPIVSAGALANTKRGYADLDFYCSSQFGISTKLPYKEHYSLDEEHFYIQKDKLNRFWFFVDAVKVDSELGNTVVDRLTSWLNSNIEVYVAIDSPQFIPLPHDQQIKLRTFANKTNISFLTEIEGTIKAQVPKSLGATVNTHTTQISNLNKELDRVKKLEESTVSTVETESDFTTVEATSNGYFEDVKLKGKTLVNLCGGDFSKTGSSVSSDIINTPENREVRITERGSVVLCKEALLKSNTMYTIIADVKISATPRFSVYSKTSNSYNACGVNAVNKSTNEYAQYVTKITTQGEEYTKIVIGYHGGLDVGYVLGVKNLIVLEGDHTQNPPSYFEGLKSVGQSASEDGADEIVVSSVKGDGNLFDKDSVSSNVALAWGTGEIFSENNSYVSDYIKVNTGVYSLTNPQNAVQICVYDINKNSLGFYKSETTIVELGMNGNTNLTRFQVLDSRIAYIRLGIRQSNGILLDINVFQLNKGATLKPYTPYKSDKKRLLFYNEETQSWEKPILREWIV